MNLLKTIAALMIFAALALLPARAATTMSVVSLTQGVYTDLGAGPMYLSAVRGNIVYQIADSANTALPAFSLTQNDPPRAISSTSHVFALALSASTTQALIASGSGISFAGSGGGGGGSVTQGTTPWVGSLTVGGSAMSASNGLFVNPATGSLFPISGNIGGLGTAGVPSGGVMSIQGVAGGVAQAASQSGVWQVTPTLTTVSTLSLTSSTTAYTSGQLVANNATAGSITNPSFTMPTLGGAIPRLRVQTTDTLSTAWAAASIQIDLWSATPTWTNGDHGTWLPATGSASHIASFTCTFPSAVWGDGLATECTPVQGAYASVTATTVYWSVQATSGSGVLTASKAIKLIAELN